MTMKAANNKHDHSSVCVCVCVNELYETQYPCTQIKQISAMFCACIQSINVCADVWSVCGWVCVSVASRVKNQSRPINLPKHNPWRRATERMTKCTMEMSATALPRQKTFSLCLIRLEDIDTSLWTDTPQMWPLANKVSHLKSLFIYIQIMSP